MGEATKGVFGCQSNPVGTAVAPLNGIQKFVSETVTAGGTYVWIQSQIGKRRDLITGTAHDSNRQ
jgi:hypothetical protein